MKPHSQISFPSSSSIHPNKTCPRLINVVVFELLLAIKRNLYLPGKVVRGFLTSEFWNRISWTGKAAVNWGSWSFQLIVLTLQDNGNELPWNFGTMMDREGIATAPRRGILASQQTPFPTQHPPDIGAPRVLTDVFIPSWNRIRESLIEHHETRSL